MRSKKSSRVRSQFEVIGSSSSWCWRNQGRKNKRVTYTLEAVELLRGVGLRMGLGCDLRFFYEEEHKSIQWGSVGTPFTHIVGLFLDRAKLYHLVYLAVSKVCLFSSQHTAHILIM